MHDFLYSQEYVRDFQRQEASSQLMLQYWVKCSVFTLFWLCKKYSFLSQIEYHHLVSICVLPRPPGINNCLIFHLFRFVCFVLFLCLFVSLPTSSNIFSTQFSVSSTYWIFFSSRRYSLWILPLIQSGVTAGQANCTADILQQLFITFLVCQFYSLWEI